MAAVLVNVRAQDERPKKQCTQCTSLPSGTYPGLRPIVWKPWCACECVAALSLRLPPNTNNHNTVTTDRRCRGSQKERDHVRLVTHPSTSLQRTYLVLFCMRSSPNSNGPPTPTRESVITRTSLQSIDCASRVISSADWTPWGTSTIGRCCDS